MTRRPAGLAEPSLAPRTLAGPLDEFCRREGRAPLELEPLDAAELPEPARSLLVHRRDMTRTLELFHRDAIHLHVLSSHHDGRDYCRESVLRLDRSDRPVEFGAIRIHLDRFREPWRGLILAEHRPLGGILNESGMPYTSRPAGWFRVAADNFIAGALDAPPGKWLYGRRNTLRERGGQPIAEIVEILPP